MLKKQYFVPNDWEFFFFIEKLFQRLHYVPHLNHPLSLAFFLLLAEFIKGVLSSEEFIYIKSDNLEWSVRVPYVCFVACELWQSTWCWPLEEWGKKKTWGCFHFFLHSGPCGRDWNEKLYRVFFFCSFSLSNVVLKKKYPALAVWVFVLGVCLRFS